MLVLSRKLNEQIVIDDGKITVEVVEIKGDKVRLGVVAPRSVSINRADVQRLIDNRPAEGSIHTLHLPSGRQLVETYMVDRRTVRCQYLDEDGRTGTTAQFSLPEFLRLKEGSV